MGGRTLQLGSDDLSLGSGEIKHTTVTICRLDGKAKRAENSDDVSSLRVFPPPLKRIEEQTIVTPSPRLNGQESRQW